MGDGISQVIFRVTDVPVELPDTSPPVIEPSILGVLGGGDWFTSNVQVSWSVTDAQSSIASQAGCATTSVTEDSAGLQLTCSATSEGGSATQTVTIRRDTTAPTLTFDAPSPAADVNGWHSGDVNVSFEAADALSGVASFQSTKPARPDRGRCRHHACGHSPPTSQETRPPSSRIRCASIARRPSSHRWSAVRSD